MSTRQLRTESGYGDLDQTGDVMEYVRRLDDMRANPFWRALKERTFELLHPQPGDHILDVGCGTGDDARNLAGLVGASGRVVGVDSSAAMIDEARRRAAHPGFPVEFQCADAHHLPYPDASFNGCRAERVLQHLSDPERALSEMIRVLRPGGRIVIVEPDYGSLAVDGAEPALTRVILRVRCEHFRSGRIGSEVPRLAKRLGLWPVKVQVKILASTQLGPAELARLRNYVGSATVVGAISAVEGKRWMLELEAAAHAGRYRHAIGVFVISARLDDRQSNGDSTGSQPSQQRQSAGKGPSARYDAA